MPPPSTLIEPRINRSTQLLYPLRYVAPCVPRFTNVTTDQCIRGFLKWCAQYKFTFYLLLLTYLVSQQSCKYLCQTASLTSQHSYIPWQLYVYKKRDIIFWIPLNNTHLSINNNINVVDAGVKTLTHFLARACHVMWAIWMGDRLRAGKPSRYVTSHLGLLSLPSLRGR